MKKRRIIIAVISIIVVAAMVLFDMLYMKKDKKEELPQEEKKVEEIVWITESSIEGVQSEILDRLHTVTDPLIIQIGVGLTLIAQRV